MKEIILITTMLIGLFSGIYFLIKQIQLRILSKKLYEKFNIGSATAIIACTKVIATLLYIIILLLVLLNL